MFICLPILFGCQTKIKPAGGEQAARLCPNCHNASVFAAKSKMWLEFFFVPIIPMDSKDIWMCGICQWRAKMGPGLWEPPVAYGGGFHTSQGYFSPQQPGSFQQGYSPAYIGQQPPK
ncbi:hypothetical protein VNI00_011417 [Paramarasmius palmivorus]|uniref:Zinc-ribbon 15 domain-containing protein n=1 Tax=Paramarasmius palmivorus TaxID=297713 RepID=A0AAW0CF78_9AGAR